MLKGYLQAYHSKESMTSLYSFFPANSLLLGILEGFNTTTLSPPVVLVSKIKYINRKHSKKLFFKPKERPPSEASWAIFLSLSIWSKRNETFKKYFYRSSNDAIVALFLCGITSFKVQACVEWHASFPRISKFWWRTNGPLMEQDIRWNFRSRVTWVFYGLFILISIVRFKSKG